MTEAKAGELLRYVIDTVIFRTETRDVRSISQKQFRRGLIAVWSKTDLAHNGL